MKNLENYNFDCIKYDFRYNFTKPKSVNDQCLRDLLKKFADILWENGNHKKNVIAFIGELDELVTPRYFTCFTQDMLDHLIGALRNKGNSNATINRKMAALSKLLRKAHKMGDIHSLPEFKKEKEKSGRIRFLEHDEETRLFKAIREQSEDAYQLSVFLVDTGCRLGEAIGLIWTDINENRVTFWITKSGRCRTVPMTERVRDAVKRRNNSACGPFSQLSQIQYRTIWHRAKEQVGLSQDKQVVPHILRHTCASRLVQGGIDIRRVQMWLGHQTLAMTMRYAHLATNDLDACLPILERR